MVSYICTTSLVTCCPASQHEILVALPLLGSLRCARAHATADKHHVTAAASANSPRERQAPHMRTRASQSHDGCCTCNAPCVCVCIKMRIRAFVWRLRQWSRMRMRNFHIRYARRVYTGCACVCWPTNILLSLQANLGGTFVYHSRRSGDCTYLTHLHTYCIRN